MARSAGGFFFVWTLWALGGLGGFTFIRSEQGLWTARASTRPPLEAMSPRAPQ